MSDRKPLASLSLDADDLWSYLKTHGDPAWERRPSYLARFFPRALDVFDELELKITFFIIGFDAARAELEDDIARAEEAILAATGQRPLGFRGPGFSWCPTLFEVLERRGYRYDASTLPTYLGPLARLYFLWTAQLTPEERKRRSALFGSFRDGLRPVHPYHWQLGERRSLLEIPVTTIPVVKVPFHMCHLLYLSRFSTALMSAYLRTAILACRAMRVEPSFLLHPLDIMGGDEVRELAFFPGMDLPSRRKVELFKRVLRTLGEHFELVPMGAHASALLAKNELRRQQLALAS